jgi:hypothetical protein
MMGFRFMYLSHLSVVINRPHFSFFISFCVMQCDVHVNHLTVMVNDVTLQSRAQNDLLQCRNISLFPFTLNVWSTRLA